MSSWTSELEKPLMGLESFIAPFPNIPNVSPPVPSVSMDSLADSAFSTFTLPNLDYLPNVQNMTMEEINTELKFNDGSGKNNEFNVNNLISEVSILGDNLSRPWTIDSVVKPINEFSLKIESSPEILPVSSVTPHHFKPYPNFGTDDVSKFDARNINVTEEDHKLDKNSPLESYKPSILESPRAKSHRETSQISVIHDRDDFTVTHVNFERVDFSSVNILLNRNGFESVLCDDRDKPCILI